MSSQFGRPDTSPEFETASTSCADGIAFYKGLVTKQVQREREIFELLDEKSPEVAGTSKPVGSASGIEAKKRRPICAAEVESRLASAHVTEEDIERLREELHSIQHSRQRVEGYLGSSRAAQAFVQEQINVCAAAESELLKELAGEKQQPLFTPVTTGFGEEDNQRSSFEKHQRVVAFSVVYLNSALPADSLFSQLQPMREPVIPSEPPIPRPQLLEIVHYPGAPQFMDPPSKFILLSPVPSAATDKPEEDEVKIKPKKTKDVGSSAAARSKIRQDKV